MASVHVSVRVDLLYQDDLNGNMADCFHHQGAELVANLRDRDHFFKCLRQKQTSAAFSQQACIRVLCLRPYGTVHKAKTRG